MKIIDKFLKYIRKEKEEIIPEKQPPNWTVVYSTKKEGAFFWGITYEFFYNIDCAQHCYNEHIGKGKIVKMRPFCRSDIKMMNPQDIILCEFQEEFHK